MNDFFLLLGFLVIVDKSLLELSKLAPSLDQLAHYFGYGYQWWIPESEEGEFLAQGVYNQYVYVNPTTRTVIVKHSANPGYNRRDFFSSTSVFLTLCRTIAKAQTPFPAKVELVEQ